MAVYTKIDKLLLESFLDDYELGKLLSFEGIQEGVENSNYKLIMSRGSYILTIFEKRVEKRDLPFFIKLKKHLVSKDFLCPKPISNKKNSYINKIKYISSIGVTASASAPEILVQNFIELIRRNYQTKVHEEDYDKENVFLN